MATLRNNRKVNREALDYPQIAAIFYETKKEKILQFVTVMNLSIHGVLIESGSDLKKDFELNLMIRNVELNQWDTFFSRVAWVQVAEIEQSYHVGLEFLFPVEQSIEQTRESNRNYHDQVTPQDLNFILKIPLLSTLPSEAICSFLNCMKRKIIDRGGVRFIIQGDTADHLYLIQKGLCSIQIQKENTLQTIAQRRENDVIGEMALLNEELRAASVISESKMVLWQLPESQYDTICKSHPDMKDFLTQLLINRLENSTETDVRHVGHYIIDHRIGQGDAGFVYKGRHKGINMPVVIKMMKHNQAMDKNFLEKFRRQAKRIVQLNHPYIVQVYHIKELYRTSFIIMEYLEGESLKALLERKIRLPFSRALPFLTKISAALAYAHDQKIVHQDIKPANIFIIKNDHIKLLDFGLAFSSEKKNFYQTDTVHYLSPEQINGGPVDCRSDIYSFGILAYEIFTGQKPFTGDDKKTVMNMHTTTPIPDPSVLVPDLPEPIKAMIIKACAKSPDQRFDSMNQILEELSLASQSLKEKIVANRPIEKEITVLMISSTSKQGCSLNQLLDDFSQRAKKNGFSLNIAGKT